MDPIHTVQWGTEGTCNAVNPSKSLSFYYRLVGDTLTKHLKKLPVRGGVPWTLTNTPVGWRVQRYHPDSNCAWQTPSPRTCIESTYHMCSCICLTLIIISWDQSYYHPHFTDEETKAQRGWRISEGHEWVMLTQWQKRKEHHEMGINLSFTNICILFAHWIAGLF